MYSSHRLKYKPKLRKSFENMVQVGTPKLIIVIKYMITISQFTGQHNIILCNYYSKINLLYVTT